MHATTGIWTGNGTLCAYIVKTTTYHTALRERESLNGITSQYKINVHGAAYTNNMISMHGMSDPAPCTKGYEHLHWRGTAGNKGIDTR